MKKILFLSLMSLCAFTASAQNYSSPGIPSGTNSTTPTIRIKPATPDSLAQIWIGIGGNKFYRMSTGMDVLVAKATDFAGVGTTSDKFRLRDTILKNNWVFRSSSTTLPALTLISPNLTDYVFKIKDTTGNTGVGFSFSTVFANEYHYWKGQNYAALNMSDSGSTVYRNLPNGYLMRWASAGTEWARLDSNGFILRTDTASMSRYDDAVITAGYFRAHNSGGSPTVVTGNGVLGDGSSGTPVILGGGLNQNTTITTGATNIFQVSSTSGLNIATLQIQSGILQNIITRSGHGSAFSTYSVSGSDPLSQLGYEDNLGTGFKTISFGIVNKGAYLLDSKTNLGILFASDYSTNQRANLNSAASVKTVIALADSVKGTIGGVTGANPTASIGFTAVNGSAGTFTRSDGAPKADSTAIRSVANSYSLAGMQTKLNNYALTSSLPTAANPTATAGASAVNGSAPTFMRSDAAPKVDSTAFRTVANSQTLAQTQTALNLKANLASPTFTGTVTIPNGGVFGTPTSMTATNVTGLPLTTGVTGILPVANGGTGTASPGIVAGTNVTVTGTWPNQTVNSSAGSSYTFSTGLTNTSSTITNNLSVGVSGGQTVIGGTAVGDALSLKGTTGNGTSSAVAIKMLIGNNGATTGFQLFNNNNILLGNNVITGTTTPLNVSFGATYGTNTPGNNGNLKWTMYDSGGSTDKYGIGMSSNLMEIQAGGGAAIGLYVNNGTLALKAASSGAINIPNLTASKVVFADASKNLTSTGIGTAIQLIAGDGSLVSGSITQGTGDLTAQTAAGNIATFTVGASTATFDITAYLNITAVATDVIETQVTYTDENNTAQTANFYTQGATSALLSAVGNSSYPPITIRAKNATVITVKTTLTTGGGSITFDAGARITQL